MFPYLFCLVAALTSVVTKNVYVTENGFSTGPVEGRIAGGEEVRGNNTFNYQVQMVIEGMKFCSGAILNAQYIVTAAHCVQDVNANDIKVRGGSDTLGQGMMIPIAEVHLHPKFDDPSLNYDIAYMKTQTPMILTGTMGSIILPDKRQDPTSITVAGWGIDGYHGDELSKKIKYVDLNVINNFQCFLFFPNMVITKNMFCAQVTGDQSKGVCKGDGGGPATETQTRKLVGISSFSRGCGAGMTPSGFTRVDNREILEFIKNGTNYERPEDTVNDDNDPETTFDYSDPNNVNDENNNNDDIGNDNSDSEYDDANDNSSLYDVSDVNDGNGTSENIANYDIGNNENGTYNNNGNYEVDNDESGTNEGIGDDDNDTNDDIGNDNSGTNDDANNDESGISNNNENDESGNNDDVGIDGAIDEIVNEDSGTNDIIGNDHSVTNDDSVHVDNGITESGSDDIISN